MRIAVDVGGTFTDVISLDEETGRLRLEKVETTPGSPSVGVLQAFAKSGVKMDEVDRFIHGTTLGLNALLTRSGARVAIVTTKGFRDVFELGRTDRDPLYDFKYQKPESLVPRYLTFEVSERLDHRGEVLTPFDWEEAGQVAERIQKEQVDAVAVCFLHSYTNPAHELAMKEVLERECEDVFVTLSHELSREYREYERTSTAVIDSYIKPIINRYLNRLDNSLSENGFRGYFLLTRSGGGAMTVDSAREQPVHLVHSGPAGGVIGAAALGKRLGYDNLITLDMGGTSLDASLVVGGQVKLDTEAKVEGLPVSIPMIDLRTIGAGGGSIAWVDAGGHLQVGPASAGARPGPVCYDKGGQEPTFTDAALVTGYLDPARFLGGQVPLNAELAQRAIQDRVAERLGLSLEETAAGILRISEAKIAGAIREISVERGFHPRDFALLGFGGAGGFVATNVAREVGIPTVIIPPGPGNFSAWGMLMVDVAHDFSQTIVEALNELAIPTINRRFEDLSERSREALHRDGFSEGEWLFERSIDLRYLGQEHAVNIPLPDRPLAAEELPAIIARFNEAHQRQYGHSTGDPVEMVAVRMRALGRLSHPELRMIEEGPQDVSRAAVGGRSVYRFDVGKAVPYTVYDRSRLLAKDTIKGPAIVEETSSTTVVHDGDVVEVGRFGELVIAIGGVSYDQ